MSHNSKALPIGVDRVKFSFRSHLVPPMIGIAVSLLVYGALNFQLLQAKVQYQLSQMNPPKMSAVAPVVQNQQTSQIIIPSIGVKAPVIYINSVDNGVIAYSLRSGVVHYATTALPGQKGNVAIFGHSSGLAWAPGDYKFVFTNLDKLKPGEQVVIDYQGKRYTYIVSDSEIVSPSNMAVLKSDGNSELSLITCTPVGTSKNRLVVHAKQVSPDPANNLPFAPAIKSNLSEIPAGN